MSFIVNDIQAITPYTPGEQPASNLQGEAQDYIKLNTNELPYPPSVEVIKALARITPQLYPDPRAVGLKAAIAGSYGVPIDMVFVSNGSDETLAFAFRAFIEQGSDVYYPDITYDFYSVFARLYKVRGNVIPLNEEYKIDIADYAELDGAVIIANPNAPTGLCLPLEQIEELVGQNQERIVIIDEAYIDFGGESAVGLTAKYDNLLVVQTFSKSRGLAGLRLGFAIGNPELIKGLEKVQNSFNPYSVNMAAQLAGTAAIKDNGYYKQAIETIIKTREKLKNKLALLGFTVLDSSANFVFAATERITGHDLYLKLKERGILVRHFDKPHINNFVRITIGTEREIEALIEEIKSIIQK